MVDAQKPITPEMKVADLLDGYPELEDLLIGMAPPFKKLRNPILRRSVAKIASLRQAAAVGGLELQSLINTLRKSVGQEPWASDGAEESSYWQERPAWFMDELVVDSFDDREPEDPNVMALIPVARAAKKLGEGEILRLVTRHLPAPGIDQMTSKGYAFWCDRKADDLVHTYFTLMSD